MLPRALRFQTSSALPSKVYLSSSPESVPKGLWHENSQHLTQSELVPLWGRGGGRLAGLRTCLLTEHKRLQTRDSLLRHPPPSPFLFSFYQEVGQDKGKPWPHPSAHLSCPGCVSQLHLSALTYPSPHSSVWPGIGEYRSCTLLPAFGAAAVPTYSIYRSAAHGGKS